MMLDSISTVLTLTLFASLGFTNAQMVGEIGDGQIQNPVSTPASVIQPSVAPPATTPAAIESAANSTLPPPYAPKQISASLPGPRVPLYTGNMSVSALATGTGVGGGGNASAPTVPAVPTVVGAAPSEGGGTKEAGTSAPVVVGNGARKGGVGMGMMAVVWGVLGAMMG